MPQVLLTATPEPDLVTVPARTVLAFEGAGGPEGTGFQEAFGALYGVAYTLKFARKLGGGTEFKVGPLEGRWWAALEGKDFVEAPREAWRWRLRLAVPDDVSDEEVRATVRAATAKKGGKLEGSAAARQVFLEHVPAQRLGRALHVGPYGDEARTFAVLHQRLAEAGEAPGFAHLEIYLSDPRRTAPARLKTVLLLELKPASAP